MKRKNYSSHTLRSYLSHLKQFVCWLKLPLQSVDEATVGTYIDHLLNRRLTANTINCHLVTIRCFYDFMRRNKMVTVDNPVTAGCLLRQPRPLPRHLSDDQVLALLRTITEPRDRAMFLLMLRSGLRVSEVANLAVEDIDWQGKKLCVVAGKGRKDRVVCVSNDTLKALAAYMNRRQHSPAKKMFLVQRGRFAGRPISVRAIQKRLEHYAAKLGMRISCHQLRHTMATQLLNADAPMVSIQELMGHSRIKTTERYGKVSNRKVQRDYEQAMAALLRKSS